MVKNTVPKLDAHQAQLALRNACFLATRFDVARYLIANTQGRLDGAEKATRHRSLCDFYTAVLTGGDPDTAAAWQPEIHSAIHRRTQQALTDRLDQAIGFDLRGGGDHELMCGAFFESFHAIALGVAKDFPDACKFRPCR